jgi:hypothetical protein
MLIEWGRHVSELGRNASLSLRHIFDAQEALYQKTRGSRSRDLAKKA